MAPSPIPSYILGGIFLTFGLLPFFSAKKDYEMFGLPLEHQHQHQHQHPPPQSSSADPRLKATAAATNQREGHVSPLAYARGIRDATYGLTYLLLQAQGQDAAITTFTAIVTITAVADGAIGARFGGASRRGKIWGHVMTGVLLGAWTGWRAWHN